MGWLIKKALPSDRRIYSVVLTEKGKSRLEVAAEKHSIWVSELMACVDSDEVNFINNFLDKMEQQTDNFSKSK